MLSSQDHLDLDVSGIIDVLLNKESIVPETGRGFLRGETEPFPKKDKAQVEVLTSLWLFYWSEK